MRTAFYQFICKILLLLILSGGNTLFAQSEKNDTIYFNKKWEKVETRNEASFYRLPRILTDSGYRLQDYFLDGKQQMIGYATTQSGIISTGNFTQFGPDGYKELEGTYRKGMRQGRWRYYFDHSDYLKKEVTFQSDMMTGNYIIYDSINHFSLLEKEVVNGINSGSHKLYFKEAPHRLYQAAYFKNGKIDSVFKFYYPNGQLKREEYYREGILQKGGISYDSLGKKIDYVQYIVNPKSKVPIDKIYNQEILNREVKLGGFNGYRHFWMIITKEGKTKNQYIEKQQDTELDKAILNFMARLHSWEPMEFDGKVISCKIDFYLYKGEDARYGIEFTPIAEVGEISNER